jgi:hypothetical protein
MRIVLKRLDQRRYCTYVTRDDGVSFVIQGVGHMFEIPHDLAHYAIESALRLERGFWGSVAEGAVFASMFYVSGRKKPHAEQRSNTVHKSNSAHLAAAEILVSVFNTAFETNESEKTLRKKLLDQGDFVACAIPELTEQHVSEARREWVAAQGKWKMLPVGAEMELAWPLSPSARR